LEAVDVQSESAKSSPNGIAWYLHAFASQVTFGETLVWPKDLYHEALHLLSAIKSPPSTTVPQGRSDPGDRTEEGNWAAP
jgi:hypothetical protein